MPNHDPEAARFVTEDLQRFWSVFPHLDDPDAVERFEQAYIQAGTPGLREFLNLQIETVDLLVQKVRTCRAYYASLLPTSTALARELSACRASFHRLAELYPEAVFPDTTFVIGRMNCGGTVGESGLLIGTEIFSRVLNSPLHELNAWERSVILPTSDLHHAARLSGRQITQLLEASKRDWATFWVAPLNEAPLLERRPRWSGRRCLALAFGNRLFLTYDERQQRAADAERSRLSH